MVPRGAYFAHGVASTTRLVIRHRFGHGPVIALQAQGDVVPPGDGWTKEPYGAAIVRDTIYGRGTSFVKSSLAPFSYGLLALKDIGEPLAGTVELHLTFDGESGGYVGPAWLLEKGIVRTRCGHQRRVHLRGRYPAQGMSAAICGNQGEQHDDLQSGKPGSLQAEEEPRPH